MPRSWKNQQRLAFGVSEIPQMQKGAADFTPRFFHLQAKHFKLQFYCLLNEANFVVEYFPPRGPRLILKNTFTEQ